MDARTVTALEAITAFTFQNPADTSQTSSVIPFLPQPDCCHMAVYLILKLIQPSKADLLDSC